MSSNGLNGEGESSPQMSLSSHVYRGYWEQRTETEHPDRSGEALREALPQAIHAQLAYHRPVVSCALTPSKTKENRAESVLV